MLLLLKGPFRSIFFANIGIRLTEAKSSLTYLIINARFAKMDTWYFDELF